MAALTDEQVAKLKNFLEFSGVKDRTRAEALLRGASWNVPIALERAFTGQGPPAPNRPANNNPLDPLDEQRQPLLPRNNAVAPRAAPLQPEYGEFWLWNLVVASLTSCRRFLLGILPGFARPYFTAVLGQDQIPPPNAEPAGPVSPLLRLQREYNNLPPFVDGPLNATLRNSQAERRPVFVYLHSPSHDLTPPFVRDTLQNQEVLDVLAQYTCWFGSVTTPAGYNVATRTLRVTGFPYVAVMTPASGNSSFKVVFQNAGTMTPPALVRGLRAALAKFHEALNRAVVQQMQLQDDRELRARQESEYDRMILDEKARLESKKAEEEKTKAVESEARRAQEEKQAEEEAERKRIEHERALALSMIPDEPAGNAPGVVATRIRFPDGSSKRRRFNQTDTLQDIHSFVIYNEPKLPDGERVLKFKIISRGFPGEPKVALEAGPQTLASCGLKRSANLFVEAE